MEIELPKKFRLARLASYHSTYKQRIGAVIYKGSRVISFGFNKINKSHPKYASKYSTIHAEINALLKAQTDLVGCSLYTYREHNKYQTPLLSKPCSNCFSAILEAGISKIYYTTGEYPYYEYIKLKEVL
ncbi:MAG: deaminase [Tenuifilaceae bacterium]|nr:deaminase [Tenuifilaceae bacterium]